MSYYRGNGLLEDLRVAYPEIFVVPPVGSWHLIYSDDNLIPLRQFHVYDLSKQDNLSSSYLPKIDGIDGLTLSFDNQNRFYVGVWDASEQLEFDEKSLVEYFIGIGLITQRNFQAKAFNKSSSSKYHDLQMKHKFVGGVTDIDLYRKDSLGQIIEIIEVKRSKLNLHAWNPFFADKGGYEILANLAKQINVEFSTIYYEYSPEEGVEDFNQLMVFKKESGFKFRKVGPISLDDFISKRYN